VKVLFIARHFTYFRNFESVIRELASRGHAVHLAAERDDAIGGSGLVETLAAECTTVTFGDAPNRETDEVSRLGTRLRLAFDYLRYLDPMYDGTPRLRTRAADRAPAFAVRFGASRWSRLRPARWLLGRVIRAAERALPASPGIDAFVRAQRPDAMLITPLIGVVRSPQPDYVRASRAVGIPTALCVWSWDHLSSKALIRDMPDRVLVWNDVQRDEARRLHGVPDASLVVTGAQCFDQWFDRQPSRDRDAFCAAVGLPADRPYVLYAGSALFGGSPPESRFVLRWIAHLRASADPLVRSVSVLIRPHPQRMREWDGVDLSGLGHVVLWGGNPVTAPARADYYDSLSHSAVVVGLNTSAFLEAAIAGRPVLAILPPEFRDSQEGTIHFHYLMTTAGGMLHTTRTLQEHERQLGEALVSRHGRERHAAFLRAFVRPHGLDVAATPVFADAVETLSTMPVAATRPQPSWSARQSLAMFRRIATSRRYRWLVMDEEDRQVDAWRQEMARARRDQRRAGLSADERAEAEREMRARRITTR
jgi:hypothetical protein